MLSELIRYPNKVDKLTATEAFVEQQVNSLLTSCQCLLVTAEDYELEAAAQAVNGLVGEHHTADVQLFAAIERQDWSQVNQIYQQVFRPHLVNYAIETVYKQL